MDPATSNEIEVNTGLLFDNEVHSQEIGQMYQRANDQPESRRPTALFANGAR